MTLSAVASSDRDGNISQFAWTQTGGPDVDLGGSNTATATFSAPLTDAQLTLSFELTVTDDQGATNSDTTNVVVNPSEPPAADAGPDQTVVEHEVAVLSAVDSGDSDGPIQSYSWVQTGGPPVTLSDPAAVEPTFAAPATDSAVDLTFEVTVTDNTEDSASDSVTVTVLPDEPPQIAAVYPCDGCRFWGDFMTVTGVATPGGDIPAVADRDTVSVVVDAGAGSAAATMLHGGAWIAENIPVDPEQRNLTVTLTATDRFGEETQVALELQQAPTITSAVFAPDPVRADVLYLLETGNPSNRLFELHPAADDIRLAHDLGEADLGTSSSLAVDAANNRLLSLDSGRKSIQAVDISTGAVTTISGNGVGAGPAFSFPVDMAFDASDQRLLVVDHDLDALFAVDLITGERTKVADNDGIGTGPSLSDPLAVAIDAVTQQAYVGQSPSTYLMVDMSTGDRAPLVTSESLPVVPSLDFDAGRGHLIIWDVFMDWLTAVEPASGLIAVESRENPSGIRTGNAPEVRVDTVGDRYLINDLSPNLSSNDTDSLVSIDPTTGAREIIYQDTVGTGPRMDSVRNVAVDPYSNQAFVVEESSLFRIDLSGGDRTLVSGPHAGGGVEITNAVDLALDLQNNVAYVLDRGVASGAVVRIDLTTGDRNLVSGGSGPAMPEVTAMVLDKASDDQTNDRLLVADDSLDAILSIDVVTGEIEIFSDVLDGAQPFVTPTGMELDAIGHRLIVADEADGATANIKLFSVDLTTGARDVIAAANTGFGPPLFDATDVAIVDPNLWIVAAGDSLMLIDGETGQRLVLSSDEVGTGESVFGVQKVAFDPFRAVIYAWSGNFEALFQFNALTGDRVVVSK